MDTESDFKAWYAKVREDIRTGYIGAWPEWPGEKNEDNSIQMYLMDYLLSRIPEWLSNKIKVIRIYTYPIITDRYRRDNGHYNYRCYKEMLGCSGMIIFTCLFNEGKQKVIRITDLNELVKLNKKGIKELVGKRIDLFVKIYKNQVDIFRFDDEVIDLCGCS